MAPELRKRKTVTETQSNGTTKVEKTVTKTKSKRKAPEDASPVSLKKQKSVKKTVESKPVEAVEASPVKPAKSAKGKGKKQSKKPVEEPVEEEVVEKVVEETLELADESEEEGKEVQTLATEFDSEDEDMTTGESLFKEGQDVGEVPDVSKEIQQASKDSTGESGVLYIGRIPHGFYEHEMRQYFEQFGPINKLRLSRNKKTGASKHFAFVEFAEASTALIVAKTMDNYLLFGHILKCRVIPKEKVREDLFKGANRRFKPIPWNKMAGYKLEKPQTETAWANKVSKEQGKRAKRAAKLKEIGYEFEAPEIKAVPAPAVIEAVEDAPDAEAKAIEAAPETEKVEEPLETETVEVEVTEKEPEVEIKVKAKKVTKAKTTKAKGKKARA